MVQVDGRSLGTTPYRRDTFVGQHEILISKPGYSPHTSTVQISEGDTAKLSATLIQTAVPVSPYVRYRKIAKWTLFGAGLVSTFLGPRCSRRGQPSAVRRRLTGQHDALSERKPQAGGIAFLVIGLGSLTASGGLFSRPDEHTE